MFLLRRHSLFFQLFFEPHFFISILLYFIGKLYVFLSLTRHGILSGTNPTTRGVRIRTIHPQPCVQEAGKQGGMVHNTTQTINATVVAVLEIMTCTAHYYYHHHHPRHRSINWPRHPMLNCYNTKPMLVFIDRQPKFVFPSATKVCRCNPSKESIKFP